ncbi:6-phosphofructokinase [bacterium]|nr:6-phosphofructokinase [bacterium]
MKKIAVLTSGGDAPGMNAAVRAVVRCGLVAGLRMYGIRRGYEGLLEGRFEEMDNYSVSGLMYSGGSRLECARCPEMLEPHGPEAAAQILERREIDGLVVIGGDGSFRGALKIAEHGIKVIGLPGTIDNDIPGTERTIGFDTACDTLSWVIERLRDTAESHHRTFVVEAMGRHSGWLALFGGLAGGADVILLPEIPWEHEAICQTITRRMTEGRTFHLVVIAEGAGRATDLVSWLQANLDGELEVRACIPGHIQRGGTPTTLDRVLATRMGQRAVQALQAGRTAMMIGEAKGELAEIPLTEATGSCRTIDKELYDLAMTVG